MTEIINQEVLTYLEDLFPQFETSLREKLANIGSIQKFEENEILMRPGQYFKTTMLLVEGVIKLYREGKDGNEFFMYFIEPGNACALSMICASKNEASAIMAKTIKPVKIISLPINYMDELMTNYKSWYYFVVETYRYRFEDMLNVVDAIAFKAMDERLEFYLKNQCKLYQTNILNLTHQQIAEDLNSSREVISRLLKKMEQNQMVKLGRNSLEVIT